VAALEAAAAAVVGHEAALFVPSGTMGNQIALHLHAGPGCEVICDSRSHVVNLELGAMAALSGLLPRTLESPGGLLDPAAVEAAIAPDVSYRARTGLVVVENSHNLAAGRHRLPVHLDGARIFNAAVALGTSAAVLAAGFSSVMFCLSKGLGAPVGSLLCGRRDFVHEARRVRKMFGGGMRQAGVLAAAGLVALRRGPSHLAEDHANAALLAAALAALPGVEIDPAAVRTNIVVCRVTPRLFGGAVPPEGLAAAVLARLRAAGVLASQVSDDRVRMVTHRDAGRALIEQAIARLRQALAPPAPG
jgi:threonine aldolase